MLGAVPLTIRVSVAWTEGKPGPRWIFAGYFSHTHLTDIVRSLNLVHDVLNHLAPPEIDT
jgi:hypothetical protein